MYDLHDTIAVVSSPSPDHRVIIRLTGPRTMEVLGEIFTPNASGKSQTTGCDWREATSSKQARPTSGGQALLSGSVAVDDELAIDAKLYLFFAPHSYTGDDVAEIHVYTNSSVTGALMSNLLSRGLRMAGPGEFTARAYLNGKMDLAQAEAVNEVVMSSNTLQLAAAEKLLSGRLAETTEGIRSSIMDCLSRIEAGLDFSGEDIEFITRSEAVNTLAGIKGELDQLLAGSISCEVVIDLPAVGIAGAPNAGKSSLVNRLLGTERSIVSPECKTTRDVLTGLVSSDYCRYVLFDCAGLVSSPTNILDKLAEQAAIEALRNSAVVVFCVDVAKADWAEDLSIRQVIEPKAVIALATKSDLVSEELLSERLAELTELFGMEFVAISAETGAGVELLRDAIDREIIEMAVGPGASRSAGAVGLQETAQHSVALTARHKQAVNEAIGNVREAIDELKLGNDEVTAMMLRAAYQALSHIEQHHIDEKILDEIFSRFCIGK
jgi:tRNA modification GTPase